MSHCPRSARFPGDLSSPGPSPLEPEPPSEIIPRLYVGDLATAESPDMLTTLRITHILTVMSGNVSIPSSASLPHLAPHKPLQRMHISLQDNPFAELVAILPRATAFIAAALRDPSARVLVHCAQGVSRSPSVVAAYLIAHLGYTPDAAVRRVKTHRRCADPNPGFVMQLREYKQSLLKGHPAAYDFHYPEPQYGSC